jgi:hypothetical protein
MSLPALEWRKLPIVTTAVTSSTSDFLNIIYNMLTGSTYFDGSVRTIGSGSAWSGSKAFVTGSNTEAILCYPPLRTALSQSILITGRNTTGASSGGTPTMLATDASFGTDAICVGLSKNSGTFTNWTGSLPMGSSSSFSGHTKVITSLSGNSNLKITIYESKEAIALDIGNLATNPTINYVTLCGAIIDPQQTITSTEAELDNRIYGLLRSDSTGGIGGNFLETTSFLDYAGTTNSPKSSYFVPQQSSFNTMACTKILTAGLLVSFTSLSGKLVKLPLYMINNTTTYSFLGTLRDVYIIRDSSNNLVFRDGSSNIVGFTIGKSEITAADSILLSYT